MSYTQARVSKNVSGKHGSAASLCYFTSPTVLPISECYVVLRTGEQHHVGKSGDHGKKVDDRKGEE